MRTLDSNNNELQNPDMTLGSMNMETIVTKHHDAVEAVAEVGHYETVAEYDNGGKVQEWIIDTPGVEAKDAYDDTEQIMRYIPYSEEQLKTLADEKRTLALKEAMNEQLKAFAPAVLKTVPIDDSTVKTISMLIPEWTVGESYSLGVVTRYENVLYKALQDSTGQTAQEPDKATSLWKAIMDKDETGLHPWVQPLGATDAYAKGDQVSHNGKTYTSNIDANVWEPGAYGWNASRDETSSTDIPVTDKPVDNVSNLPLTDSYPEWKQPSGATDTYAIDAHVAHNGKNWKSTAANNVWEPGAYGWVEI